MTDVDSALILLDIPHSARIWNFWMGGKDYYEIDRIVGHACMRIYPDIATMAVQSRQFLIRAVRYLAGEAGIRQFIDIGCGLPGLWNTHEVAQSIAPTARVVYVDNDPLVLAHAWALLKSITPKGVTTWVDSDFHCPEQIISEARNVLNFTEPVAVMFMGVLGHATSYDELRRIVNTMLDAVPSGSYLALWDGTDDNRSYVQLCDHYAGSGAVAYVPRPRDDIRAAFDGLEMVAPGFVSIPYWRAEDTQVGEIQPISAFGAVARKS